MGDVRSGNTPKSSDILIRMLGLPYKESLRIEEALTHRSASHERGKKKPIPNYERLEFLGDRVIGLIVSEYLLNIWPAATEGEVGQIFSTIVSTQTLASIARRMDLGSFMILGKGSHSSGERDNHSLLADTFESLAAAIYVEYGLETARQVFIPWFAQPLQEILRLSEAQAPREASRAVQTEEPASGRPREKGRNPPNYKLLLQKWSQQNFSQNPEIGLIEESGPSHQKKFVMGIYIKGTLLEQGTGTTKRGAIFQALRQLWERIQEGFQPELSSEPSSCLAKDREGWESGEKVEDTGHSSQEQPEIVQSQEASPVQALEVGSPVSPQDSQGTLLFSSPGKPGEDEAIH